MTQVKYTKMELRAQQVKLSQLEKYLPTLQLKKAMLQVEINETAQVLKELKTAFLSCEERVAGYQQLLTSNYAQELFDASEIDLLDKHYENIAGVEIPIFEKIVFKGGDYFLFNTPYWLESGIAGMRSLVTAREKIAIFKEKKHRLEKELREVSIRVNLFEKIMIPRAKGNIKKIKIFLGDQQLAAVSQAKAAKKKILKRKEKR